MPSYETNRGAKRAREAREALGYTREGPLPDLLEAVEERGGTHAVVLELRDGLAGAYIAKPDCPLLFVNGSQALTRQRFTLAHEFGHHRMSHATVVDDQASVGAWSSDPNEVCANAFAAEFLMPRDAVAAWGEEYIDGGVTLEHVVLFAYEYGVSPQAARYALETAKVLVDPKRCKLLDDEIAEGLQLELASGMGLKPVEDQLANAARRLPRIPPALASSTFGDLLAGDIDQDGLAAKIGSTPEQVADMLNELGIMPLLSSSVG